LPWQALDGGASGPWQELAACMLIANRAGAATRADIGGFILATQETAARLHASCDLPDAAAEAARADELDRFCADLDVQIGLTLLRSGTGQIAGTRLRGVAEAAGFKLSASGQFDYVQDETGAMLYSLQNYKQEPFTLEGLRVLSTPGVVFLLDVPRVAEPVRVFDQMRLVAKRMAQTLEAVLVDDNRRPLNDASLTAIRAQVQATAAALREAHIEPGEPRALRLFG
jgi:FtsZ-interacting cell division protein ZipA